MTDDGRPPRRVWLVRAGAVAAAGAFAGQGFALARALWPDVPAEPASRFKIGRADDFADGITFLDSRRLFILRRGNEFAAISAVCTHLGCTVKQASSAAGRSFEFLCPCHGSRYRADGTNAAGPAPRPLDRYRVETAPDDGQLLVDADATVDRAFRLSVTK